jgi:hypothetical protein
MPIFSGFGQFSLYILALEKQRFCALLHQRFCETDKLMSWSQCPRGDAIDAALNTFHNIPDSR